MSTAVRRICDRCGAWCRENENCLGLTDLPADEVPNGFVDLCEFCIKGLFAFLNEDPEGVFGCDLSERDRGATKAVGDVGRVDDPETDEDEDEDERVLRSEPLRSPGPQVVPLPFPETFFQPGEVRTIEVHPQLRVALNRLVVSSTCAAEFVIEDIQFAEPPIESEPYDVPALVFSEVAHASAQFSGAWADAEHPVRVRVRHVPRNTQFFGMFLCELLKPIAEVEP